MLHLPKGPYDLLQPYEGTLHTMLGALCNTKRPLEHKGDYVAPIIFQFGYITRSNTSLSLRQKVTLYPKPSQVSDFQIHKV